MKKQSKNGISIKEIDKAIKKLKIRKACGIDGILMEA